MLNMIIYYFLALVWFKFLMQHLILTKNSTQEQYTAYNSKIVLLVCGLIAMSWIFSIPFYVLKLERV